MTRVSPDRIREEARGEERERKYIERAPEGRRGGWKRRGEHGGIS